MSDLLDLTVIIPVLNEAENIPKLHAELHRVMTAIGRPFELLFIDTEMRERISHNFAHHGE